MCDNYNYNSWGPCAQRNVEDLTYTKQAYKFINDSIIHLYGKDSNKLKLNLRRNQEQIRFGEC